jgi:signal transduction histidine kinase
MTAEGMTNPPTRGRAPLVARALWWAAALLLTGLFVAGLPNAAAMRAQMCPAAACTDGRPDAAQLQAIQAQRIDVKSGAAARTLVEAVVGGLFIVCGGLIYARRSDDLFSLFMSLVLMAFGAATYSPILRLLAEAYPIWGPVIALAGFVGDAGLMLCFCLFPDGYFRPRATGALALGWALLRAPVDLLPDSVLNLQRASPPLYEALCGAVIIGCIAAQVWRIFNAPDPVRSQQSKWAAAGMLAGFGGLLVTRLMTPGANETMLAAAFAVYAFGGGFVMLLPLGLTAGATRYRLGEVDGYINRALVYGALTASIVIVYAAVVGVLGALVQVNGGLVFVSLVATGLVAVLLQPLREWLQRGANRLIYGDRDDPYRVISRLGQRLEATLSPDTTLSTIVETVAEALKLPYGAIELKDRSGAFQLAAEYRRGGKAYDGDREALPLTYQSETVGRLQLGLRAPGEPFSAADRRLLEDLARQAGAAVQAAQLTGHLQRLTADLQRSRERLVTAREEERRRLRRDLHDGLGPMLANLTLQLEAARDLLANDPAAADALLAKLTAQAQEGIADIRRLVYELRPPALDEFGLLFAIQEQAAQYRYTGIEFRLDAPDRLPALPAAVEVAAYRIAQEALTNVVRHAGARCCDIRLTVTDDLCLDIRDDGKGIQPGGITGVGLNSMRERADELGGVCTIDSSADGTHVRARLPLFKPQEAI